MTRSIKPWFEVAAFAITLAALLAIVALAMRLGEGLAMATSTTLTTFFCVFIGAAVARRGTRRRDPASISIKDELGRRSRAITSRYRNSELRL